MKQVQNQTKQTAKVVEAQTSKIKAAFSKVGKIIGAALSVAALVRFGKSCIELGSALAEVQNVVDVTFGEMADDINQFAKDALEQFGLSETTAKKFTSTLGAMLKSMKFSTKEAAEMSKTMTGLAADMASFYNLDTEEAFNKIRAGISGETEPLKQLGINLSVANLQEYALSQGITKSYNAMTQQEQALLRYNYLLQVTADAQGDFARTSDGWANQIRILTERWNALKAAIGQGLIAVLTPVVRVLNILLEKILQVTNAFSAMIAKITGKSQKTQTSVGGIGTSLGTASDKAEDLTTETTKAGGAAKKAKKEYSGLASFDEIHNLQKGTDTSGSGSGGGTGAAGGLDDSIVDAAGAVDDGLNPALDGLINRLKELWELFKNGFKDGLGDVNLEPLKAAIQGIKDSLKEIWEDPRVQKAFHDWCDAIAYNLGVIAGSMASIGITIATNLVGGLNKYLDQNKERIKLWLVDVFDITAEIARIRGNLWKALADIFSVFGEDTGQQVTANIIGIFADAFMGLTTLFLKFERDLELMFYKPIWDNKAKIKEALRGILEVFESVTGSIKEVVDNTMDKANEVYDSKIKPVMDSITRGLSDTVGKFFDMWNSRIKPVLDDLAKKFDDLMDNHIQPMIDSFLELIGAIAEELGGFYNDVLKPMMDWVVENIIPVIADFVGGALSVLMDALGWLADRIRDLNNWLNEHRAVLEVIITVVGAIAAAIAIVQGVIAAFMGIMATVSAVISGVAGAFAAVKAAILAIVAAVTSPIGIIVAIIAAVIAIGVLLYRHWDEVKAFAIKAWNAIKTAVQTAMDNVSKTISNVTQSIKNTWDDVWTAISTFFSNIWNKMKEFVTNRINTIQTIINTVLNLIKNIFTNIWNAIYSLIMTVWNNIKNYINTTLNTIQTIINTVLNTIKNIFTTIWNAIYSFVMTIWNNMKNYINTTINTIQNIINTVLNTIKNIFTNIWNAIYTLVQTIWNNMKNFINTTINTIQNIINTVLNTIKTIFTNIWNAIYTLVQTIWNNMKSFINTTINTIQSIINTVLNTIQSIFNTIWNAIYTLVQTVWNNLKTFISNTINTISTTISTVLNSIQTTFSNIWNSIYNTVTTIVNNMKDSVINAINGLKSTWDSVWNGMKDAAVNAFNGLWGGIRGIINNILGGIESMANGVVRGINRIIEAANAVGDLVGIEVNYVSEVSLPRLAKGGIIDSPMFAEIGENGREAVVPLEKNTGWMDNLAARLGEIMAVNMQEMNGREQMQTINTVVKLDTKTLVEQTDQYRQRRGYQMATT